MGFPQLETDRLHLVQIKDEYTQSYYEIMSRNDVTKYYGMDSLKSKEEARQFIDFFQKAYDEQRAIRWGIVIKESGEFIGTVGLNNLNTSKKKAEIGYELHPTFWRKGFTNEVVKEVLQYSFEELELYRVGAVTYPQNEASIQLLKRLSFVQEGLLRGYLYQDQQSHDALIFSLIEPDWIRHKNLVEK
ncbi:GNAT family N-acetyltransferase [Aquibacillus koreensis]|uniref:GNAT family N-acetyltransferase n=1 Tax=Aquibacillus koreensis TaxID=279446 RepID=A0A9X3WRF9_9BACI|nr:GNAT family protein [Aquibacillus koreensis]MCT2536884.1 GNAT family N-acetyltransferase [Aquibacillus koreensis]MDC3421984.1 GNAT family N-acetyltransferase [Aquibacillus koreensis]